MDGSFTQLGISTSSSTKIHLIDLKINFINILPKDSWLDIDGAGTFQERRKRVVLSSCAVMCIRNFLSSTGARGRVGL